MVQAIAGGSFGVADTVRIVHRLQEEVAEILTGIALGFGAGLRIDQLQFIAMLELLFGIRLGADADPVDARRRQQGAVGLDADLKSLIVQRCDKALSTCKSGSPPVQTT